MERERRYLQISRMVTLAALLALVDAPTLTAQTQRGSSDGSLIFSLSDVLGRTHSEKEMTKSKAAIFFFVATECPISNRYAPEIGRIASDYGKQPFVFYGVHSDPDLSREVARQHAADFGYQFPVLLDPQQQLAATFGVTLTPTVVIVSASGQVIYRGRIDNRYLDFGRYRDAGITPDLRLALDAVIGGRAIATPFTKSVGCAIPAAQNRRPAGSSSLPPRENEGD